MDSGKLIDDETRMRMPADAILDTRTREIRTSKTPRLWNYETEENQERRELAPLTASDSPSMQPSSRPSSSNKPSNVPSIQPSLQPSMSMQPSIAPSISM